MIETWNGAHVTVTNRRGKLLFEARAWGAKAKLQRFYAESAPVALGEGAGLENLGGGWWRLPDGRKVQGEARALAAMAAGR